MHVNGGPPKKPAGREPGAREPGARESGVREQLLTAALKVYATAGMRGATTKRIAQEAGVNEVTLFRHFGSKEALLRQAVSSTSEGVVVARLPQHPEDPEQELMEFCRLNYQFLFSIRSVIRTSMAESGGCFAHPAAGGSPVAKLPIKIANELHAYLLRLRSLGLADQGWNTRAAVAMLMGAIFVDATQREIMPERFPYSPRDAVRHYVTLFLRAIGVVPARRRIPQPDAPNPRVGAPGRRTSRARHA